MNTAAFFCAFLMLPYVIDGPGQYITRGGEQVTVERASTCHDFGCKGAYSCGTTEGWHKSGRLLFGRETCNDIVRRA